MGSSATTRIHAAGRRTRFFICDTDGKVGTPFERVAEDTGIDVVYIPVEAPKATAICERFIGSVMGEWLDHISFLNERHLRGKVKE